MGKDKSHRSYTKYTKYRNLFNRIKRTQKQNYFNEQFSKFRHNAKMTWSVINEVIGRNNDKLSPVDCFKIKNSNVTDKRIIVEEFCALFTNVGKKYVNEIPNAKHKPSHYNYG